MDPLTDLLSSRVKAEVLRLLFAQQGQELHVRELARRAGLAESTVRQELQKLGRLEIVVARRSGNRTYYKANARHPLFPDIRNIVRKTAGRVATSSVAASDEPKGVTHVGSKLLFDRDALQGLCRRHHIVRLSLFGSVLAGTDKPGSDVDLLVEFEPGKTPGLLGLAGIEMELSALLSGRRVDLRTPNDLSSYFRDEVLRIAEVQYAA